MATVLTCSHCEKDLKPHCHDGHCGWWTCRNRTCPARIYDTDRGLLLHEDGTLEHLGAT